eukprot:GHVQ01009128.1.p1 GENE.GHVQ01009128.1~~GHVQ01009128.1.p1  ORF type:complete len:948 (+),score=98.35 GHVQ01009128.1:376-3219(+)
MFLQEVDVCLCVLFSECCVDLGASYMHCTGSPPVDRRKDRESSRSVLGLCKELKPRVAEVCGSLNWESTLFSRWYNEQNGKEIGARSILRMNELAERIYLRASEKLKAVGFIGDRSLQALHNSGKSLCEVQKKRRRETRAVSQTDDRFFPCSVDWGSMRMPRRAQLKVRLAVQSTKPTSKYPSPTTATVTKRKGEGETENKVSYVLDDYRSIRRRMYGSYFPYRVEDFCRVCEGTVLLNGAGRRKALWELLGECCSEELKTNSLGLVSDEEWKMLMAILQSKFGYVSRLEESSVGLARQPAAYRVSAKPIYNFNCKALEWFSKLLQRAERVSVHDFEEPKFGDKFLVDGWKWLTDHLGGAISEDIRLNCVVTRICCPPSDVLDDSTADCGGVLVEAMTADERTVPEKGFHGITLSAAGKRRRIRYHCKFCIVTIPLGVLNSPEACPEFDPPLSEAKQRSCQHFKMGSHNKVVLRFRTSDIFWPPSAIQLNCLDQKFQFMNLHAYGKIGCLLAHCFPPFSIGYEELKSEQQVVDEVLGTLQGMFSIPDTDMPTPVDYVVTLWTYDPFSLGSYSYPGTDALDDDICLVRSPHPIDRPKVLFAGEHISRSYYQCVDGAFDTGHRAAECVAHELLKLPIPPREQFGVDKSDKCWDVDVFNFPDDRCPFTGHPIPPLDDSLQGYYLTDASDEGLSDLEGPEVDMAASDMDDESLGSEHGYLTKTIEAACFQRPAANDAALSLSRDEIQSIYRLADTGKTVLPPDPRPKSRPISAFRNLKRHQRVKNGARVALTTVGTAIALNRSIAAKYIEREKTAYNDGEEVLGSMLWSRWAKYELLCWICSLGGELLLCDAPRCLKVWHRECAYPVPSREELASSDPWICPVCRGVKVRVGIVPRIWVIFVCCVSSESARRAGASQALGQASVGDTREIFAKYYAENKTKMGCPPTRDMP